MSKEYGQVLDGREAEIKKTLPGKVKPGDLLISFDGWFVRGHEIDTVEKIGGGNYRVRLLSSKQGTPRSFTVHANSRLEYLPKEIA